jgi:D-xylonolactonase
MYITTAGGNNTVENGEHAGALYRMNIGIKGVPEFHSRIGL